MLTERDLWIFAIAVLIVGVIVTLYVLPAWWADRKRYQEPVDLAHHRDRQTIAALARRAGLQGGAR